MTRRRRDLEELRRAVAELWAAGLTAEAIAVELGARKQTVQRIVRELWANGNPQSGSGCAETRIEGSAAVSAARSR